MEKLVKLHYLSSFRNSIRTELNGRSLLAYVSDGPHLHFKLGKPAKLRLSIYASSEWVHDPNLNFPEIGQGFRLEYDDGSIKEFWIVRKERDYTGESDIQFEAEEVITDLSRSYVYRVLSTNEVQYSFPVSGIKAGDALNNILSTAWNAPDYFALGNLATEYYDTYINGIQINGTTHMEAIKAVVRQINDGQGLEWETSYDSTNDVWNLDFYEEIGGGTSESSDRQLRLTGSDSNERVVKTDRKVAQNFSSLIPVTKNKAVGIGDAEWVVDDYYYDGSNTLVSFPEKHLVFSNRPPYANKLNYGRNTTKGINYTLDEILLEGTTINGNDYSYYLMFVGDITGNLDIGDNLKLFKDSNLSKVEKIGSGLPEKFWPVDIPPANNMASNPELSIWSGTTAINWGEYGSSTVSINSDNQYIQYGRYSAHVDASSADTGIRQQKTINPQGAFPYYSVSVNIYVVSGTVELTIVDPNNTIWPYQKSADGKHVQTSATGWNTLSVGGLELPAGQNDFAIVAKGGSAKFYLDSASITNTVDPYPYSPTMGAAGLLIDGLQYYNNNYDSDGYSGMTKREAYDPTLLSDSYKELIIGAYYNGGTTYRIIELETTEHRKYGRPYKKVTTAKKKAKGLSYFLDTNYQKNATKGQMANEFSARVR